MNINLMMVLISLGIAAAVPLHRIERIQLLHTEEQLESELELYREKRQFNAQGGGSRSQGFGLNANARAPIWESQNQRHAVHGTTGYSQHVGGPYGSSRPDVRGGIQYSHRF